MKKTTFAMAVMGLSLMLAACTGGGGGGGGGSGSGAAVPSGFGPADGKGVIPATDAKGECRSAFRILTGKLDKDSDDLNAAIANSDVDARAAALADAKDNCSDMNIVFGWSTGCPGDDGNALNSADYKAFCDSLSAL